jgi:hypothetical protein
MTDSQPTSAVPENGVTINTPTADIAPDCVSATARFAALALVAPPRDTELSPEPPLTLSTSALAAPAVEGSGVAVTRIQLRLPDGSRILRRFFATDTVSVLYAFASAALSRPHTLAGLHAAAQAALDAASAVAAGTWAGAVPHNVKVRVTPAALVDTVCALCGVDSSGPRLVDHAALGAASAGHAFERSRLLLQERISGAIARCPPNLRVLQAAPAIPSTGAAGPVALSWGTASQTQTVAGLHSGPFGDEGGSPSAATCSVSATALRVTLAVTARSSGGPEVQEEQRASASCLDDWDLLLPHPSLSLGLWGGCTLSEAGLGSASVVNVLMLS